MNLLSCLWVVVEAKRSAHGSDARSRTPRKPGRMDDDGRGRRTSHQSECDKAPRGQWICVIPDRKLRRQRPRGTQPGHGRGDSDAHMAMGKAPVWRLRSVQGQPSSSSRMIAQADCGGRSPAVDDVVRKWRCRSVLHIRKPPCGTGCAVRTTLPSHIGNRAGAHSAPKQGMTAGCGHSKPIWVVVVRKGNPTFGHTGSQYPQVNWEIGASDPTLEAPSQEFAPLQPLVKRLPLLHVTERVC